MGLLAALDAAVSGLNAINIATNTVANNVANAQNPDFNALSAEFQDLINGGVIINDISRRTDLALRNNLLSETNSAKDQEVRKELFTLIEQTLGTISGETPLTDAVEDFNSAWKAFEAAPESDAARTDLILTGQSIVAELSRISAGLDNIFSQFSADAITTVDELNERLAEINRLNNSIVREKTSFRQTSDLENQRDAELLKVAEIIDIRVLERSDGRISVYTIDGLDLVDATASEFTLNLGAQTLTKTGQSANLIDRLTDGRLRAQIDAVLRDADSLTSTTNAVAQIEKIRNQLDEFAFTLVDTSTVSTASETFDAERAVGTVDVAAGTTLASLGLTVGDTFTVSVGGGAASTFTVGAGDTVNDVLTFLNGIDGVNAAIVNGVLDITTARGNLRLSNTGNEPLVLLGISTVQAGDLVNTDITTLAEVDAGDVITFNVGGSDQTVTIAAGETFTTLAAQINALNNISARVDSHGQLQVLSEAGDLVITDTTGTTASGINLITGTTETFAVRSNETFSYAYKVQRSLGTVDIEGTADLTTLAGVTNGDTFDVTVGGTTTTVTISTGDSAADLVSSLNDIAGVRARFVNGNLEISTVAGTLALADNNNTPLTALGLTVITGQPQTGESSDFFEVESGTTPLDASRINLRVNDTIVNGTEVPKQLVSTGVVNALGGNVLNMRGSGVSFDNESYSGLAASILVEITQQAGVASRVFERSEALRLSLEGSLRGQVGVNVDEELALLTQLQNSYAASARVLSVIDEMLTTLENVIR
ncbi:MAG: flagellin hook IN motif-containing protein [Alphaproteobacteria bacterium]